MVFASTLLSLVSAAYAANSTYAFGDSNSYNGSVNGSASPAVSSQPAAPVDGYNVTTTIHTVDTLTVPCDGPTTFSTNGQTYTVTEATTLTITDCPCTVHEKITRTETTCPESEATSSSQPQTIDAVASVPTTTTVQDKKTVTIPCSDSTEVPHNGTVITVTTPTTLTLTDCPEETSQPQTVDAVASSTPSTTYSTLTEKLTLTTRLVKTIAYNNDKASTLGTSDVCEPVTVTVTEYNNGPAPSTSSSSPKTVAAVAVSSSSGPKANNNSIPVASASNATVAPEISNGSNKAKVGGLTALAICVSALFI